MKVRPRLRGPDFKISTSQGKRRSQLSPRHIATGTTDNIMDSLDQEYQSIPKVYDSMDNPRMMMFGHTA